MKKTIEAKQALHKKQFENIYDIICNTQFADEARKEFKKFIGKKEYQWDGDNNIIKIGRDFEIKLIK